MSFCCCYNTYISWVRKDVSDMLKFFIPISLLQKEQVKRLYLLFTVKDSAANIPSNLEARRRLEFFTNSLFMDMPQAKPVFQMMPFWYYSFTNLFLQCCRSCDIHLLICLCICLLHKICFWVLTCPYIDKPIYLIIVFVCKWLKTVSSHLTIVKQCFIVLLSCEVKMRMVYLYSSICRKYFQVCDELLILLFVVLVFALCSCISVLMFCCIFSLLNSCITT